jgi:O-antigen biosynthesis protein
VDCLIIGKVWPEPGSTAAGRRTQDIVLSLSAAGWKIHFASAAQPGTHALDLEALGVTTQRVEINASGFDSWIKELAPDVVIFDRFMTEEQFGWRVAAHCPDALRVLDTSDLHCLRIAREQALKTGQAQNLSNETALREIASIYRSDLSLMISQYELELLCGQFALSEDLIDYWPFSVDPAEATLGFAERAHFMMIGSFLHPPNLDAARWCRECIWPIIRKALPETELHLYGSYGERFASELHAPDSGFHFKGRAEDSLQTMLQYRLNLAPLRYGAGLKGKVFDGFLTATPTVMTPIAAEGIASGEGWAQPTPEAFAKQAIELYSDSQIWRARQVQERQLCQERFDPVTWRPRLPQLLASALEERAARRQRNFIGQMLRHHHHRSTEFMSRWIEAKKLSPTSQSGTVA